MVRDLGVNPNSTDWISWENAVTGANAMIAIEKAKETINQFDSGVHEVHPKILSRLSAIKEIYFPLS